MAKRNITWTMDTGAMKVTFKSEEFETFIFSDIKDYMEPMGVTFELFRHGLKQKLADSVAGMAKDGKTPDEQIEVMNGVWNSICKGEFSTRKPKVKKISRPEMVAMLCGMEGVVEESELGEANKAILLAVY